MAAIAAAAPTAVATEGGNAPRRFGDLARRRTTRRGHAVVLAAAVLMAVTLFPIGTSLAPLGDGAFTLIAQAAAAEERLFAAADLVGLASEIVVEPLEDAALIEARWLPLLSIGADGQVQYNQLKLGGDPGRPTPSATRSWYDPASHRFAHAVSLKGRVLFANAYDGRSLHLLELDPQGNPRMKDEPVAGDVPGPERPDRIPGDFLVREDVEAVSRPEHHLPRRGSDPARGRGPGTRSAAELHRGRGQPDVPGPLPGDHPRPRPRGRVDRVRLQGHKLYTVRRAQVPVPREPQCGWDLAGLRPAVEKDKGKAGPKLPVQMLADMVRPSITVEQMAQGGGLSSVRPGPRPALDPPPADRGRPRPAQPAASHVRRRLSREGKAACRPDPGPFLQSGPRQARALGQAALHLARGRQGVEQQEREADGGGPADEQRRHRDVHRSAGPGSLVLPAGDAPGDHPVIAINGTLTEAELHELANSLVPAKAK